MLRPSKLQSNSVETGKPQEFKLKPSALGSGSGSVFGSASLDTTINASSQEQQPQHANPFLLAAATAAADAGLIVEDDEDRTQNAQKVEPPKPDENSDPLSQLTRNPTLPKSNLFTAKSSITDASDFVFGENISERVTGTAPTAERKDDGGKDEGNLFSHLNNSGADASLEKKEVDGQSLLEATRIYEEKCKVQKRKYEEVETKTGEEDERNVLEVNCKLFAFVSSNYEERGRGMLRLNDSKSNSNESRVVFRTSGSFRVLVNTKVWPGMIVESPSNKSLRLTAIDAEGHIKVFLLMARPDDVTQLLKALEQRVHRQQQLHDEEEFEKKCPKPLVEIRIEDASNDGENDDTDNTSVEPQVKKIAREEDPTTAD